MTRPFMSLVGVIAFSCGCAPMEASVEDPSDNAQSRAELACMNGMTSNGLSSNGLSSNGLSTNGLSTNGFTGWFNLDPGTSDMVMKYIVKCAVASDSTRTWTNPVTGLTYTWEGLLGLAPGWASGSTATDAEQQLVTGCLAAHTNKYDQNVRISVLGRTATGAALPIGRTELTDYSVQEGCFFGNLFAGAGIFVGPDSSANVNKSQSTLRACAIDAAQAASQCPPLRDIGTACSKICTREATSPKAAFTSCTFQGKKYLPITTRISLDQLYKCGDGVCQFTEKCGTAANTSVWDDCGVDCGVCP